LTPGAVQHARGKRTLHEDLPSVTSCSMSNNGE